jgi:hypothetical protein
MNRNIILQVMSCAKAMAVAPCVLFASLSAYGDDKVPASAVLPISRPDFISAYLNCGRNTIEEYLFCEAVFLYWREKLCLSSKISVHKTATSYNSDAAFMRRIERIDDEMYRDEGRRADNALDEGSANEDVDDDYKFPQLELGRLRAKEAIAPERIRATTADFVVSFQNLEDWELKYIAYFFRRFAQYSQKARRPNLLFRPDAGTHPAIGRRASAHPCFPKGACTSQDLADFYRKYTSNAFDELVFLKAAYEYGSIADTGSDGFWVKGSRKEVLARASIVKEHDADYACAARRIIARAGNWEFAENVLCPEDVRKALLEDKTRTMNELRVYAIRSLSPATTNVVPDKETVLRAIMCLKDWEPQLISYVGNRIVESIDMMEK